jgi:hypothetical protein
MQVGQCYKILQDCYKKVSKLASFYFHCALGNALIVGTTQLYICYNLHVGNVYTIVASFSLQGVQDRAATLSLPTLCMTTLCINTLSMTVKNGTLSVTTLNVENFYAECCFD